MIDGQDLGNFILQAVDDSIAAHEELADGRIATLGNDAPDLGEMLKTLYG